jgi:hypothetical protein
VWRREITHKWKYGIVCLTYKKGDIRAMNNYRPATLLCTTYNILDNILCVKLAPYAEEIMDE